MSWQDIVAAVSTKFQNMEANGSWGVVDPPDAKFLALTTKIVQLELQIATTNSNPWNGGGQNDRPFTIEEWRLVKNGESVMRDGRKWWWCPKHNNGAGMYVRHPPEEHDK